MEWTYSLRQTQQANKTLRYRRLLALPQELFRDQSVGQLNDTVSLPTVMYSPFERGGDACYSGVAPDLMEVIEKFNEAADRAVGQTEGCIVCLDTLGTPEGDPPPRSLLTNGTAGASRLSMVTLQCGHTFHEHCLMTWLSPISYPSMEHDLGVVATVLENRSITIDLIGQLPRGSEVRATVEDMVAAQHGRHNIDAFFQQAWQEFRDPDDELEEGEIREEPEADGGLAQRLFLATTDRDRFTQALYPINPFTDRLYTREVFVSDVVGKDPDPRKCPHCRQPAGLGRLDYHADIIQLIRSRLRHTNLAYQCLKFTRTSREENQRIQIEKFLHRRYKDNNILAIEDVEAWTLTNRTEHLFKQARLTLREVAFLYMKHNRLSSAERLRIMQLATFYESFRLKYRHVPFFFNTCSTLDEEWDYEPTSDGYRHLHVDPAGYCLEMSILANADQDGGQTIYESPPLVQIEIRNYRTRMMYEDWYG